MLVFVGEKDAQTNPDQETKKKGQLKAKECQSELMSTLKAPIFPRIATDLVWLYGFALRLLQKRETTRKAGAEEPRRLEWIENCCVASNLWTSNHEEYKGK